MRFAVSTVSPPGYLHSAAFQEVAETLHHALGALGHDSVLAPDLASSGRRHIVLGSNLLAHAGAELPPGSILYNLEQVDAGSQWLTPELLSAFRRFPVWDYSEANIERLAALGVPRPRHVPLGYVSALTRIPPAEPDLDVLFYGSLNPRRRSVLDALAAAGLKVAAAFGVYGAVRDALIARSRLVLNVHFYAAKVFEIVRVSYLLANRRAVVSERGADPSEESSFEGAVAFADYGALVPACLGLLERPLERERLAASGFALMSSRPAERYLEPALAALT